MLHRTLNVALLAALVAVPAAAQIGPGPFAYFPTEDITDARMLSFGCTGIDTFEQRLSLTVAVPPTETEVTLSVFDGDTGKPDLLNPVDGHWDLGNRQLIFDLYFDPLGNGNTAAADLVGSWKGNDPNPIVDPGSTPRWTADAATMPDNDWWNLTVTVSPEALSPSGNYFYHWVVTEEGTCTTGEQLATDLKIAASSPMTFLASRFGFEASFRALFNDGPIIYPAWDGTFPLPSPLFWLTTPTTYDGTFEFFLNVPLRQTELVIFDGDFDVGTSPSFPNGSPSGVAITPCSDANDADTPALYGDFPADFFPPGFNIAAAIAAGSLKAEGTNSPGNPSEDNSLDAFRRGELGDPNALGCVRYELIDPFGTVYDNDNPSGNLEWERFRLATNLATNPANSDYVVAGDTLPVGIWKVKIFGLDLANLNFWRMDSVCAVRNGEPACAPPVFVVGDTVWFDTDGDGVQDPGEPGIPGVVVNLIGNPSLPPLATRVTGDTTAPGWTECVRNNTGLDTAGLYCFGVNDPGAYRLQIAPSNFAPGGALANLVSTTGGETQDNTVVAANVLTYDFGYRGTGKIGDRVWFDTNGNGVQNGVAEPGINGVTVTLLNAGGTPIASQVTSGDGNYLFTGLPPGTYTVVVTAATLPAGLLQTFDLDGLGTPNRATLSLGLGQTRLDVDFGYNATTGSLCLPALDFETNAAGGALATGQIIDDEFAAAGIHVTTNSPVNHPAMIFNSASPTGGDVDLGTPNQDFGGPGIGAGGRAGQPGQNAVPLGKILIISEDGDSSDPDDNAGGGTLIFTFDLPVQVYQVQILDIDEGMAGTVTAFNAAGGVIGAVGMAGNLGDNSVQTVTLGASGVRRLEVHFPGSGAVSAIVFCPKTELCAVKADVNPAYYGGSGGHAFWLPGIDSDLIFDPPGSWVENGDGTASLTGTVRSAASPTHSFTVNVQFSGFSAATPAGSPHLELNANAYASNGGPINPATWRYYQTWGGTMTGTGAYAGATISIVRTGPSFQIGTGASGKNLNFGASGWFLWTVTRQPNQGSLKATGQGDINIDLKTDCTPVVCQAGNFKDRFDAASFSGNNGTLSWAGAWIENDVAGVGPSSGNVRVGGGVLSLRDQPDTGTEPSAARTANLAGAVSATLSFDYWTTAGVDADDAVKVEVSSNGGASYTVLETFTNISGAKSGSRSYNISAFISSQTRVRIRVSNLYGGDDEYFKVDNVQIVTGCTPPVVCQAGYFKDSFNADNFTGNNGTLTWAGAWSEYDVAGSGATSGNVRVSGGKMSLRDKPDTGTEPSSARKANLAGAASATFSFSWWTTAGVDTDDDVKVEVSSNGGTSYTVLETFTNLSGAKSGSRSYNISAFISSQTTVRFRVTKNYGGDDEYFKVDDVKITTTCGGS